MRPRPIKKEGFFLGLTSYSGTTFRVIIRYWHDLFPLSNTGTTFFGGSDTGTTSAFSLRWHFLFFPPPPGCHMFLIFSLSLHYLPLSSCHGDVDDGDRPPGANSRGRRRFFRRLGHLDLGDSTQNSSPINDSCGSKCSCETGNKLLP